VQLKTAVTCVRNSLHRVSIIPDKDSRTSEIERELMLIIGDVCDCKLGLACRTLERLRSTKHGESS